MTTINNKTILFSYEILLIVLLSLLNVTDYNYIKGEIFSWINRIQAL